MRCFVAAVPDEATQSRLDALVQTLRRRYPRARSTRTENLHLTLAFIGELPAEQAAEVARRLGELHIEPFTWHLTEVGGFARARVVWAGGADEPRLAALAAEVRRILLELHVAHDDRPFVAHVTLLRQVAAAPAVQAIEAIAWPIRSVQLMVSEQEAAGPTRYRRLEAG